MPEIIGRCALDGSGRSRRIGAGATQETHAAGNAEEPDRASDGDPRIDTGDEFRPGKRGPAGCQPLDLRPGGEADRDGEAEEGGDRGEAPGGIRPLRQDRAREKQQRSRELRGPPRRPGERLHPRAAGEARSELEDPASNRFVGDLDSALNEEFLNIAVAQGEPQIEPNRVADDLRREAVTIVGNALHPLPYLLKARVAAVSVTEPVGDRLHALA